MPVKQPQEKPNIPPRLLDKPRNDGLESSPKELYFYRSVLCLALLVALASAIYYHLGGNVNNSHADLEDFEIDKGDAHMFTVVDLPGKGKGVIAARDIQQGELVIRERPLFVVPHSISTSPSALISHALSQVSYADREAFFNLSYVHFPEGLEPDDHPDEVALAIFQTNAVAAGDGVGIFPRMARLNHGCSRAFNVVYTWREREQALVVHALKSIQKGQELLTTYTNTKQPRDQRRVFLSQNYGFHCACDVCSLSDTQSLESDKRLTKISENYQQFATWGSRQINGIEAIRVVNRIWNIEEEEGYWSERGQLAADAAWVAASHSDTLAAQQWAQLAIMWYSFELGGDSEQVQEMQEVVVRPQAHRAWGTRERLEVGGRVDW